MKRLIPILLLLVSGVAYAGNQTYEDVLAGKSCSVSDSQQLNCDYRVGKDLDIGIAGIGMPDTGITFYVSNYDGDYYGTFGILHSCVIVSPGKLSDRYLLPGNKAFISPMNGKVYEDWQSCQYGN